MVTESLQMVHIESSTIAEATMGGLASRPIQRKENNETHSYMKFNNHTQKTHIIKLHNSASKLTRAILCYSLSHTIMSEEISDLIGHLTIASLALADVPVIFKDPLDELTDSGESEALSEFSYLYFTSYPMTRRH
jgi:hypothetical protein